MLQIKTITLIISQGGYALEDSDSDVCHIGIVDIVCMGIGVIRILREDYHLPYVQHGGGRPPT